MRQQRISQTKVAFGVFKVDRIDFVRHGGRTNLAFFQTLLEVTQRDITPDITVQIQQNSVGARHGIEQHSHPVVRLDLDRVCVLCKAKSAKYAGAKRRPVDLWIGGEVSVVVTCSPVELGQW